MLSELNGTEDDQIWGIFFVSSKQSSSSFKFFDSQSKYIKRNSIIVSGRRSSNNLLPLLLPQPQVFLIEKGAKETCVESASKCQANLTTKARVQTP